MSKKNFLILITIIILSFMLPGFSTAAQPISPVIHKINNFEKEGYYYDNNFYPLDETVKWAQGFCYHVIDEENKKAIILGYDSAVVNGEELFIPTEIKGYKIQGFSHGVFNGSNFKRCDLSAFPNLSQIMFASSELEEVILSKQTKIIPTQCFAFTKLKKIQLPNGLEEIKTGAFQDCLFTKLIIPGTVKSIGGQGFEGCDNLTEIEFKNGFLTEIGSDDDQSQWTFMTKNLKKLTLPENIKHIGKYEFMESTAGRHWYVPVKYPDNLTVYGKKGSYAETYAAEHELSFMAVENKNSMLEDEKVNFESKYDISQYMDSSIYKIYDVFDTDYGAVVYYSMGGVMKAPGPGLSLVRENGDVVDLSLGVSKKDLYRRPEHNDITLSEDGKYVTFNVSFDERAEGPEGMFGGNLVVYHDAGTYYYKADLETGECIETKFEPLDIISEGIISEWAKIGVEKAIELGFVPVSFRDNYKRNITRGEFAKLAMFFLSMQYGYSVVPEATYYSLNEVDDNSLFPPEFMNAYACSKTDRNGKAFRDKYDEEKYVYHNTNVEIKLPELSFSDLEECKDLPFIERAYHIGIVNGISEKEFNPDGDITRQEAAAMLMRVYKNYAEVEKQDSEFEFSDDEKISAWAKEDVYNINALGIMKGVGEDNFAPLDGYTIEQAIVTFWRLYDLAPVSRKNKNITPLLDYEFESENYYDRDGGSYFHELTRKKYEDFIYVYGYWTQRHSTASTYSLYVFDKYGGVALEMFANDDFRWEVNSNGKVLTTYWHHTDTFKRYDKNIGTEKEYEKGMYQAKYDMEKRKILSYEKVE